MTSLLLHCCLTLLLLGGVLPPGGLGDAAIQCPDVQLKFPFDLSQFLGTWFEIARFSRPIPTPASRAQNYTQRQRLAACVRTTFSLRDDGRLRVERIGLDAQGEPSTQIGDAESGAAERARLAFRYPGEVEEDLGVVEVDYGSHALLYGCHLSSTGHVSQDAWILGRESHLAPDTLGILKGTLASRRVDIRQFGAIRQEGCEEELPDPPTIRTPVGEQLN